MDLVGAGMMVTLSYPIYHEEDLLGVVSRDITLTQLSNQALKPISSHAKGLVSFIVDGKGLAIATARQRP